MKNHILLFTTALSLILLAPVGVSAHPGRTDSKGGHTCQTSCTKWGLTTGEYHLHGADGGYANSQGQKYDKEGNILSSATKPPATPVATVAPSPATSTVSPAQAAESTPTPSPQASPTTTPTPPDDEEDTGSGILWTIFFLFAIPIVIGIYLYRKYRK